MQLMAQLANIIGSPHAADAPVAIWLTRPVRSTALDLASASGPPALSVCTALFGH